MPSADVTVFDHCAADRRQMRDDGNAVEGAEQLVI